MSRTRICVSVLLAVALLVPRADAQSLTFGLFERYLDALRKELAIPGLSVAVVQNGRIAWDRGFGFSDVGATVAATASTPYPIANLSETFGAALLLQQCVDRGDEVELTDRVQRWTTFPEPTSTIAQVLGHVQATGAYGYNSARFGALSGVVVECVDQPYPRVLATQILDRLAMIDSVPGRNAVDPAVATLFATATVDRYRTVLARLAVPYRIDSKRAPSRSDYAERMLTASTGIVSTVRDLANFDMALSDGLLLTPASLTASWTAAPAQPMGLGWFVQNYNGEPLVWHFGLAKDNYSSLIVKLPRRRLTLILLANSDGLTSSFNAPAGDATQSIFVRLFLRLFTS